MVLAYPFGSWRNAHVYASAEPWLAVINPATGVVLSRVPCTDEASLQEAVQAAQQALPLWSQHTGTQRGRYLLRLAALIREHGVPLARLEAEQTGKPVSETLSVDIPSAAECLEYFAGLAPSLRGDHVSLDKAFAYTRREPWGVVGLIAAWNYPLQIACWKLAPALACGNTVILKPSEYTPLSALYLGDLLEQAGFPMGVCNLVLGGKEVGCGMVAHPGIPKISLTGSVATGKSVMALGAGELKKVTLELGGKSPLIICPDANLSKAVQGALWGNFYSQGEVCSNGTRVFVHRSLVDPFLDRLICQVKQLRVGDPLAPETQIGSLIRVDHRDRVLSFIEQGRRQGAELCIGGDIPLWSGAMSYLNQGAFLNPAVFVGVQDTMTIAQDEIFGPVMSVLVYDEVDEVLARANRSPYGLAAGVYTQDLKLAHHMAARLEVGMVWINQYNITPVEIPFGGYKHSGIGRENGTAALEHYTQLKTVYVDMEA